VAAGRTFALLKAKDAKQTNSFPSGIFAIIASLFYHFSSIPPLEAKMI